ncbi:hypothetical Protein YC6258_02714 [Gynuella sunshinyii YC6258]|uniref:Uncharacterized protein n=2 Tax=Gynuella sunshinyii TaxID=1445505 RepID=A0A0C5VJF7_9GAMM|nr:hypothetical Protein YC6258_02714 [Gynuella sunshinyii YC6258]
MNMIESENWGGRVYFNDEYILLGIFIGKKHNKNWETPPNWDGSHDMLQRYNERFKKD